VLQSRGSSTEGLGVWEGGAGKDGEGRKRSEEVIGDQLGDGVVGEDESPTVR
jgi:hypothetical protein